MMVGICSVCTATAYGVDAGGKNLCPTCMVTFPHRMEGHMSAPVDLSDIPFHDITVTPREHFHVVEFINGCLNDYDSGPHDSLDDARQELESLVMLHNEHEDQEDMREPMPHYVAAGEDRYTRGSYILKIESCTEACYCATCGESLDEGYCHNPGCANRFRA